MSSPNKITYGYFTLIRLAINPLMLLFWGPYRFIFTLWNSRVLARGRWSDYISFGVPQSINQLFYRTQIININRHGRDGISPYLSLGDYSLGYWWHLSLPSSYIYYVMGAVLPIASLFGWLFMHFFWLIEPSIDIKHFYLVLMLALFSSTFFANMFVVQNYNALGWLFFPLALWALINDYFFLLPIIWITMSFFSITVVVMAGILSSFLALYSGSLIIFLTFIPAAIKIALHFYWSTSKNSKLNNSPGLKKSLIRTIKSIGISSIGVKYKRISSKAISKTFVLFLFLYSQFGAALFFINGDIDFIWITGMLIFLINSLFIRFADVQSIYMLMFSIATYITITTASPLILISYWLVISPPSYLLGDRVNNFPIDLPPPLRPYNISKVIDKVNNFLAPVQENDKVLFSFNDPDGKYDNVFDGYRTLLELPLYVATKRKFLMFPSWWAVFENNFDGANEFWGRSINDVKENTRKYNANYVIAYNQNENDVESFLSEKYEIINKIDWSDLSKELLSESIWEADSPPKWTLYKVPNTNKN